MHRRAGALAVLALLAGCGGGSTVTAGSGTPTTATTVAAAAAQGTTTTGPVPTISSPATSTATIGDRSASILPSVEMTDVARGTTVDLASLIPAQRPVLLWFWAPH